MCCAHDAMERSSTRNWVSSCMKVTSSHSLYEKYSNVSSLKNFTLTYVNHSHVATIYFYMEPLMRNLLPATIREIPLLINARVQKINRYYTCVHVPSEAVVIYQSHLESIPIPFAFSSMKLFSSEIRIYWQDKATKMHICYTSIRMSSHVIYSRLYAINVESDMNP